MYTAKNEALFVHMEILIKQGNNHEFKSILSQNQSLLNLENMTSQTLLHTAANYNNFEIAEHLINFACNIDAKDIFGWTPLMIATLQADHRITELLLKANADIFIANSNGKSALQMFLNQSHIDQLDILDMFFYQVKSRTTSHEDLLEILNSAGCQLHVLVHLQNAEVTKLFLEQQSDIDPEVVLRSVYACMTLLYEENLKVLLQCGVDVEERRRIFLNFFYHVAKNCEVHETKMTTIFTELLIKLKFLNEHTSNFVDILFMTATEESLRIIIESDINSYIESEFGYKPIVYIFGQTGPSILNLIKSNLGYANALGRSNLTGLHIAACKGAVKNVEFLLEMGANPNAVTKTGKTPLFFMHEDPDRKETCVRLLLQHGADLQACNNSEEFVFDYVGPIDKYSSTIIILLNHLALLKIRGVPIKDKIVDYANSHEQLIKYYEKSLKQLEDMKTHNVCGSLNLFQVLTATVDFTSRRVGSLDEESFRALFRSDRMQHYDRYYIEVLYDHILKALALCILRKRAMVFLCDAVEMLKSYYVVLDKICSFLTDEDLRVFS